MIYDKLFQKIIKELAVKHNLPEEVITVAYRSYWEFVKSTIKELELKEGITEEEFNKLRTNFNIPSIGKLYVTWDKLEKIKKRRIYIKNLREKKDD
jgi:hypothetical protein